MLWTWRPRTDVYNLLRLLNLKRSDGRAYVHDDTKHAYQELRGHGLLVDHPSQNGYVRLHDSFRGPLYRHLVDHNSAETLRKVVFEFVGYTRQHSSFYWHVSPAGTVALLRIALLTGMTATEFKPIEQGIQHGSYDWDGLLYEAIFEGMDAADFDRIVPELGWKLLIRAVMLTTELWRLDMAAACDQAQARMEGGTIIAAVPEGARLTQLFLLRGDAARLTHALDGLNDGPTQAMRAALLCQQGRYPEAQQFPDRRAAGTEARCAWLEQAEVAGSRQDRRQ